MNTHFSPLVDFSLQYEAVCVLCSVAPDSATLWTRACQAPLSVHGIFQARILEQVAVSCSKGFPQPEDRTTSPLVPCTGGQMLYG